MHRTRSAQLGWRRARGPLRTVLAVAVSVVIFASITALAWGSPPWGSPPGPCVPPGQTQTPPSGQYGGPTPPSDQYTPPGAGSGPPGQPSGVAGSQYGCPPGLQYGG